MEQESSMRKDIRNACSKILYEDKTYFIGIDSKDSEGYNLLVNDAYLFLGRSVLSELAMTNTNNLEKSISNFDGIHILNELKENNIPLSELGWALAKAVIKNKENY